MDPSPPPSPTPEKARRERSRLGLLTVSLAAIVSGALAWAGAAGADGLTPSRITAVALAVVGAGLVVGTWYGRARCLIAVGLLLALALGTAAAADATGATLRGGVGNRSWVVDEGRAHVGFALGVGDATLDLTSLPAAGPHVVVTSRVGLGHLVIVVPDGVPIRVRSKVRIGDISEFGNSLVSGNGTLQRTRTYGPGDPGSRSRPPSGPGTCCPDRRRARRARGVGTTAPTPIAPAPP